MPPLCRGGCVAVQASAWSPLGLLQLPAPAHSSPPQSGGSAKPARGSLMHGRTTPVGRQVHTQADVGNGEAWSVARIRVAPSHQRLLGLQDALWGAALCVVACPAGSLAPTPVYDSSTLFSGCYTLTHHPDIARCAPDSRGSTISLVRNPSLPYGHMETPGRTPC